MQLKGFVQSTASMKFATNVAAKKSAQRKLSIKEDENANNLLNITTVPSEDVDTPILSPPCHAPFMATSSAPEIICTKGAENLNLNISRENLNCRLSLDNRKDAQDEAIVDCTEDYFEGSHCYRSRVNSTTDDSGFVSSENDDKEDIVVKSLARLNGGCPDNEDDAVDENGNQRLYRTTKSLSCTSIDVPSSTNNTDVTSSSMNSLDSLFFNRNCRNSKSRKGSKPGRVSLQTKEESNIISTDSTSSSSITTHEDSTVPVIKLKSAHRRRRANDHNNNRPDVALKNVHTMLPNSPGRLNDCFQEHGLLSFVACIVYTLALMILLGVLGLAVDTVKSVVGKEDLKEMRQDLVRARKRRSAPLTSG